MERGDIMFSYFVGVKRSCRGRDLVTRRLQELLLQRRESLNPRLRYSDMTYYAGELQKLPDKGRGEGKFHST